MRFCIHVIVEELRPVSRSTCDSFLTVRVLQDEDFGIKSFENRESARDHIRSGIYEETYGWKVMGYEIREYIEFGSEE